MLAAAVQIVPRRKGRKGAFQNCGGAGHKLSRAQLGRGRMDVLADAALPDAGQRADGRAAYGKVPSAHGQQQQFRLAASRVPFGADLQKTAYAAGGGKHKAIRRRRYRYGQQV